jgi:hypothetical protein
MNAKGSGCAPEQVNSQVDGTDERRERLPGEAMPTQALADRQTDTLPETEIEAQPVVAHQDRRFKSK